MNKVLFLGLLVFTLAVLAAGSEEDEQSLQSFGGELFVRGVREADPRKLSKKGRKNKKKQQRKTNKYRKKNNSKGKKKNNGHKRKMKNNKKKSRKTKKSKGQKRKIKNSKRRKNKKKAHRKKHQRTSNSTSTCLATSCVDTAVKMLKLRKDKVTNYLVQDKRIQAKNKTGGKKSGKGNVFGATLQRLISNGGGNASALACGTNTTNAGAKQMMNLTSVLSSCQEDIKAACHPTNIPQPNITLVTACRTAMTNFDNYTTTCSALSGATACTCWANNTASADVEVIKTCDLKDSNSEVTKAVTKCKAAFGKCRKYEDDVGTVIQACTQDSNALKSKMKNLSLNKNAITSVQTKVKSLTGTSRSVSTCANFTTIVTKIITMISEYPSSYSIYTLATSISNATVTCSTTEIATLNATHSALSSAVATLESEISVISSTLTSLTGETVNATEIASFTACTTAAACAGVNPFATNTTVTNTTITMTTGAVMGRREYLVQKMLANKMSNF